MHARTDRQREALHGWLMASPALALLVLFVVVPLVMGAYWSFTNKRLISPLPTEWVGWRNYNTLLSVTVLPLRAETDEAGVVTVPRARTLIRADDRLAGFTEWFQFGAFGNRYAVIAKDPTFLRALLNTFLFVLLIVPGQGGLALLLALLVDQKLRGVNLFRTAYFTPIVTSIAIVAIVWAFLYNPQDGLFNSTIRWLSGGRVNGPNWLIDPNSAMIAIAILSAWHSAGLQMVIFLAGLQGIPDVLYEAAKMDGAGGAQRLRFVTLPMLRNTTIFVVISTTILAFRVFTQIDVMTRGGPQNATISVIYHAVNQGFREQRIGYASAVTVVFFGVVLLVALLQQRVLRSDSAIEPTA